jgi:hypothetical protein
MILDTQSEFRGKSLAGLRFSRLTVLSYAGKDQRLNPFWNCICDCGKTIITSGHSMKQQRTKSCGCWKIENSARMAKKHRTTHGCTSVDNHTPEYWSWGTMIQRCTNPNSHKYASYGGRGITVCEEWRKFENFWRDMGPRPSKQHSINRIDNDGPYCKSNCEWATLKTQCRNRRSNRIIECDGVKRTLTEWSEITGLKRETIAARLRRGCEPKQALTEPIK